MARQKGITKIEGTLDNLNFYTARGQDLVRMKGGGFNGEAIRKSPKMERVRENMTEFGNCSTLNMHIRLALQPLIYGHKDGTLLYRLQSLLQEIKIYDTLSVRGQRKVGIGMESPMGSYLFEHFAFTPLRNFSTTIGGKGDLNWADYTYTVSGFEVKRVRFPKGATHLEVNFGVLRFDFVSLDYKMHLGTPLVVPRDFAGNDFTLVPETLPEGSGKRIAFGAVRFYQEVGGQLYLMKEERALGVGVLGIM